MNTLSQLVVQGKAKVLYEGCRIEGRKRKQKQRKGLLRACTKKANGGGEIRLLQKVNNGQNTVVKCCQDLRDLANGDAAGILTKSNITAPMRAIFNMPVVANERQSLCG